MGRYSQKVQRLLGLPEDGSGIPFGSFRPCDIQYLVEELASDRISDLKLIADDPDLSAKTKALVSGRRFHTFEDFCQTVKQRKPQRNDVIDYGASLQRGKEDLESYLHHIREHDPGFADFLHKPQPAAIARGDLETSVYITGKTKSGKSYLAETLAHAMARQPKTSIWIIDPHGPLARGCAEWKDNLGRNVFYFDAGLHADQVPKWNPFDQLPDDNPKTLDVATQEQVKAFSIIADKAGLSGNMENFLSPCIYLMLAIPNGSMQELFRLMDDNRNEDLVSAGQNLKNERHRDFFLHDFSKKTFKATKEAIAIRLSGMLAFTSVYNITNGRSTFSIPEAFNRPGVYIFNLSRGELGGSANTMFGRLILANLQAAAFKRDRDKQTEKNVPTYNCVFIDECHNFVNETTGTIVSETRKYGLMLFLIQQFVGQHIDQGLFKEIMVNTPLKLTGHGSEGGYRSVAQSQGAPLDSFYGIKPRLFHVSNGDSVPFIASASSLLASRQERMTSEEWRSFIDGQLSRWYGSGEVKGVSVVHGAAPEEYAHERPLKPPVGVSRSECRCCWASLPPPVSAPPPATVQGVFAAMRRKLTGKEPSLPVPATPATLPAAKPPAGSDTDVAPKPPEEGYEPEVEVSPGVFHSRRKPKYPRP